MPPAHPVRIALSQGRYICHDQVLRKLAEVLEGCQKANKELPSAEDRRRGKKKHQGPSPPTRSWPGQAAPVLHWDHHHISSCWHSCVVNQGKICAPHRAHSTTVGGDWGHLWMQEGEVLRAGCWVPGDWLEDPHLPSGGCQPHAFWGTQEVLEESWRGQQKNWQRRLGRAAFGFGWGGRTSAGERTPNPRQQPQGRTPIRCRGWRGDVPTANAMVSPNTTARIK